jgi:hypothetical protein
LRECSRLKEWVLSLPAALDSNVMMAFEFDRWPASASADRERDRLDVLGLDGDGRLVVAKLKGHRAPATGNRVNMKAIKSSDAASGARPAMPSRLE